MAGEIIRTDGGTPGAMRVGTLDTVALAFPE
jgi:hypothetical protein